MTTKQIDFVSLQNILKGKRRHDHVILFHAHWCGWCKKFKPVYREVQISIPRYEIDLASNGSSMQQPTYADLLKQQPLLADAYGIKDLSLLTGGFPTTIFFTKDQEFDADKHVLSGFADAPTLTKKLVEVYGATT